MKAITTKYHPCGNVRGARISASDGDGNRVYIDYPHELSGAATYAQAAIALCAKMGWEGDLISGGTGSGYVFVFAESERFVNPTRDARRAPAQEARPGPCDDRRPCDGIDVCRNHILGAVPQ